VGSWLSSIIIDNSKKIYGVRRSGASLRVYYVFVPGYQTLIHRACRLYPLYQMYHVRLICPKPRRAPACIPKHPPLCNPHPLIDFNHMSYPEPWDQPGLCHCGNMNQTTIIVHSFTFHFSPQSEKHIHQLRVLGLLHGVVLSRGIQTHQWHLFFPEASTKACNKRHAFKAHWQHGGTG
jgi:hypothetical protein